MIPEKVIDDPKPTKQQEIAIKREMSSQVVSATLHLIYESDFSETNLWPKKGFKVGSGIHSEIKDALWVGCNPCGFEFTPKYGRIGIHGWNTGITRINKQLKALELIIDQSIYDNVYFDYELTHYGEFIWFTFTIGT